MRRSILAIIPNLSGDIAKLQRNLQEALEKLAQMAAGKNGRNADNAYITASLASGDNTIEHSLGRVPVGWSLADQTAAADIYRVSWSSSAIVLNASASASIRLEVW